MLFYVGTYSVRGSHGIYTFRLDAQSGALTPVGSASGGLDNLSYQALHPNGKLLYSASETNAGEIVVFGIDAATGLLHAIGRQSALGGGTCYVGLDHKGKHAFAANYGTGTIAVLPVGQDGQLGAGSLIAKQGAPSGVSLEGRQTAAHAHSIQADRADRYVFAADLGCDKLFIYRFDAARGSIRPASPGYVSTRPGAGPRHFAFHPAAPMLFLINELDSTITSYRYNQVTGSLGEAVTLSTLPTGFSGTNHAAEIRVHPAGRFLYGSNRGHDSIAGFAIDAASGRLNPIGFFPTLGKTPRNFGIDPTGNWLIAANQDTDRLVVFRVDLQTGRLAPSGVTADVPSPVCVTFASADAPASITGRA